MNFIESGFFKFHDINISLNIKMGMLLAFLISILVSFCYHPFAQPLSGDRAYFMYHSMLVAKGIPLYDSSMVGYTPYGYLLSGYLINVFSFFGIENIYYAPRISGMILNGLISVFLLLIIIQLSKNIKLAFLGVVLYTGIAFLTIISNQNLEPKFLVAFFQLLSVYFVLKRKYFLCGISSGIGLMTWQPAIVILVSVIIYILFANRQAAGRYTLRFAAGAIIACLPFILYIFIFDDWNNFFLLSIQRKIMIEGDQLGESPLSWFGKFYSSNPLIFILSLSGILWYLLVWIFKQKRQINSSYLFLFISTIIWFVWNSLEFQSQVDLIPIYPILIIWVVYLLEKIPLPYVIIFILMFIASYRDIWNYFPKSPLSAQKSAIQRINNIVEPTKTLALHFPAYYILNEIQSPVPYLFLRPNDMKSLKILHDLNCKNISQIIQENDSIEWIVIPENEKSVNACVFSILNQLGDDIKSVDGYIIAKKRTL